MPRPDTDLLIEQAVSAWRPRRPDGAIPPNAAWADLSPAERLLLFEETLRCRALERGLDEESISGTCRSVLARIRGIS